MRNKKSKNMTVNNGDLTKAKERLSERKLFEVNEGNKNEYYENIINEFANYEEYRLRAMGEKNKHKRGLRREKNILEDSSLL